MPKDDEVQTKLARFLYEQHPERYTGWQNADQAMYEKEAAGILAFLKMLAESNAVSERERGNGTA